MTKYEFPGNYEKWLQEIDYQLLIVYHPFNNILHYSEPQLQLQKYVFHLDHM